MAKELVLDVIAKKSSRELSQLADEFDKLAKDAESSGKKIDTTFSGFVDRQIEETKKELISLRQEFAKTGDLDVGKNVAGLERNLKGLEKIKKSFGDTGQEVAKSFSQKFRAGLGEVFGFGREVESGLSSELLGALATPHGAAAAAAVASAAGVSIGGALLTGIGLAGIGAGIAGQLHSPQVKAGIDQLKFDLSSGYKDATKSFAGPTADAISILDKGWKDALPGIKDTFTQLAPEVRDLAAGATGFLSGTVTGLEHAAVASKPLLADLSRWLPDFGQKVGGVFDEMAAHEKQAKEGLHAIELGLDSIAVSAKYLIPILGDTFDVAKWANVAYLSQRAIYAWNGVDGSKIGSVGPAADKVAEALDRLGLAGHRAADGVGDLNVTLSTLLGNQMSVDQANDKFREDLLKLKDNLDAHSRSLSQNSEAGLHNRDVILQLIQDAQKARDAQIQMAGGADASKASIDKANSTYKDAIDKIEAMGVKAGLSKKDLDALAGTYNIDVIETIYTINHSGLEQNVTPHDPHRHGGARAGGGPVMAGYTYTVDEYGREEFTPGVDGYITPAGRGAAPAEQTLRIILQDPRGETLRTILVNHGRASGFRTVDELLPVGSAR